MDFVFQMMEEILNTSKIRYQASGEIIGEIKSRGQASLIGSGHQTALLRGASYGSPMARFQDEMAGVGYYKFIEDLEKNFQDKKSKSWQDLRMLWQRLFPGFFHGKLYR